MNFPSTPTLNQTYSFGGKTWLWNGHGWELQVANPLTGYTGSTNISTLGTITTGTWNGNVIDVAFGGTGLSTYTPGSFLYAADSTTIGQLTAAQARTILNVADGATANAGTVTSLAVVSANGISGSVSNATTTPAITLSLGAITPTSVAATGTITGSNLSGTHTGTSSGTNTGDQTTITGNAGSATYVVAQDLRDVTPSTSGLGPNKGAKPFFVIKERIEGSPTGSTYGDFMVWDTYSDASGGSVNALFFKKNGQEIFHYQGAWNATSWSAPKQLAYTDSNITGNAASATTLQTARTINGVSFNGSANITITAAAPNSLTAGNGLTGTAYNGSTAQTFTLGTPSTITNSTTNSVTSTSHTHALTVTKADVGLSLVENTALSTWAGSTNITTVGAVTATSVTVNAGTTTSDIVVAGAMYRERAGALTTTAVTTANLDIWAIATFRSAKYTIQAVNTVTGHVHMTEIMVIRDNSNNVHITEFATMTSGTDLAVFTADYDGTANVRLRVTPASTNNTQFKFAATIFNL